MKIIKPIETSVALLVQENEWVKVRLREGTSVQGCMRVEKVVDALHVKRRGS